MDALVRIDPAVQLLHQRAAVHCAADGHAVGVGAQDVEPLRLKLFDQHEQGQLTGDGGLDQEVRRVELRPLRAELSERGRRRAPGAGSSRRAGCDL